MEVNWDVSSTLRQNKYSELFCTLKKMAFRCIYDIRSLLIKYMKGNVSLKAKAVLKAANRLTARALYEVLDTATVHYCNRCNRYIFWSC